MKTKQVKISDSAIKSLISDNSIRQLRDPRFPLYLRFNKARTGGFWYLRDHRNDKWHRLAIWPMVSAARLVKDTPMLMARLCFENTPVLDNFEYFGELLQWFLQRTETNSELSAPRKRSLKSLVGKHLIPRLDKTPINDFAKSDLEDALLWPLQETYENSTVRQVFQALKAATNQAVKSGKLNRDPLTGIKFNDLVNDKIQPKPSQIKKRDIARIASDVLSAQGCDGLLCQMMLLHGTRIGETRQLEWPWIDSENRVIEIPEQVTKTKSHLVYLSEFAFDLLVAWHKQQRANNYRGKYVFVSANGKSHLSEKQADDAVNRISKGLFTSHDFRKLCRVSWLEIGIDSMVAELMLNHELTPVQKTYVESLGLNVGAERRRAAWQAWCDHLLKLKAEFESETVARSYDFAS